MIWKNEKGKYYQIEVEKRIRKQCNVEIEDELHFLLNCPKLEEKRLVVLNSIYSKYNNISLLGKSQAFVWLMSTDNPYI